MVPASQVVRTPTIAFALTAAGAWAGCSVAILGACWDAASAPEMLAYATHSQLECLTIAPMGAMIGGVLALLFGATLSRQYCWLFALTSGLIFPVAAISFIQSIATYLPGNPLGSTMRFLNPATVGLTIIGCIGGGITLGVIMTRARTGFGRRSRIAAWIGLFAGSGLIGIVELAEYIALSTHLHTVYLNILLRVIVSVLAIFACAAVPAVFFTDRPRGVRFQVTMNGGVHTLLPEQ